MPFFCVANKKLASVHGAILLDSCGGSSYLEVTSVVSVVVITYRSSYVIAKFRHWRRENFTGTWWVVEFHAAVATGLEWFVGRFTLITSHFDTMGYVYDPFFFNFSTFSSKPTWELVIFIGDWAYLSLNPIQFKAPKVKFHFIQRISYFNNIFTQ